MFTSEDKCMRMIAPLLSAEQYSGSLSCFNVNGEDTVRELTSWKEVATYLGVSVRTAQKWELEKGLSVKRLPGQRARISASTADLDAWKAATLENSHWWVDPRFLRRYAIVTTALLVVGLAIAAYASLTRVAKGRPTSYRIDGSTLIITDDRGTKLWEKRFSRLADPADFSKLAKDGRSQIWFGDLDEDGKSEVLFIPVSNRLDSETPLICYSQSGEERWRFVPGRTVATRVETYSPPYHATFSTLRLGRKNAVLVVSSHHLYYPAQVALLSTEGRLLREYWHSGRFERLALADLNGDGESEIYLAGVNNGRQAATLIVLDPERFSGASAEPENPDYQLQGFRPGIERARILFPRSCISRNADVWNIVAGLLLHSGAFTAEVWQQPHAPAALAPLFYRFNSRLEMTSMTVGDGFTLAHQQLEAERKLDHDLSPEELAALRKVEYITGGPKR